LSHGTLRVSVNGKDTPDIAGPAMLSLQAHQVHDILAVTDAVIEHATTGVPVKWFPQGQHFDMLNQPRGPYRLTAAEHQAMHVSDARVWMRSRIKYLEDTLKSPEIEAAGMQRLDPEDPVMLTHWFTRGIYARQFKMRAGSIVVGKLHAQEHLCIISAGRAVVTTEEGTQEIAAPCMFVSPAGSKRALVILEDMVWTTIHRTEETDPVKLEAELILGEDEPQGEIE
jgi:quercetin dioxygenase-like cupin family protein